MAQHLAAFFQSTNGTTLSEINTVADDILTQLTGTHFATPPDYHNVYWGAASATNLQRAQIRTPTLQVRRISGEIFPRRQSSPLFNLANLELWLPPRPIALKATEDFEVLTTDNAGVAQSHYGLISLGPDTLPAPPAGDIRTVRATGTTTLVQGQWKSVTVTPDLSLEPGQYTLIGFAAISANCIAARALITGQQYRPGVIGLAGTEAVASDFDYQSLVSIINYDMGNFNHLNIPQFQFLADAADTSETVYMYVIRTGEASGLTSIGGAGP